MKNSLTDEQLKLFSLMYGDGLARAVASCDPASFATRVPPVWLDLVAHPGEPAVRAIWDLASAQLPRFVDYLARSITGAAIFEMQEVPVLAMALPDWSEEDCELRPGFCRMGTPTAGEHIERFVERVGAIPPPLERLWRVANFIDTKEHSIVCSLHEGTLGLAEAPVVLPPIANAEEPEGAYECLQVAVVNNQMVTCMTRGPGRQDWNDLLVRRFRRTDQVARCIRKRLDDLLADWSFSEWAP